MKGTEKVEIKHVILPFDFSSSAKNALKHAISIAKNCRTDITILCVMDLCSIQSLKYRVSKFADFEEQAYEMFNEYVKQTFTVKESSVIKECLVSENNWTKAVHDLANHKAGALIVLGTGSKGQDDYFSSSHAHKIVDSLHTPVLVIKEEHQLYEYRTITTPLDETFHTREKLLYVTIMANAFDAKVSLVGLQIHSDRDSAYHMQAIMRQASQYIQVKVRHYQDKLIASKNEIIDLVKYADEEKTDLLVIMGSHEKSLSHLFSRAYAQQVADKANAPVLICPKRISMVMSAVSI